MRDDYVQKLMNMAQNDTMNGKIAQVMLLNLKQLGNIQNQELAKLCYVDPATISRFVKSLGFKKYGEFKSYFNEYNEIYDIDYYFDFNHLPTNQSLYNHVIQSLEMSKNSISWEMINQAVQLIQSNDTILIGGDRFSALVAEDLQIKLLSLGYYGRAFHDVATQYDTLNNDKGLFILFSASCTRSRAMLKVAKKNGWKIVLITRNPNVVDECDVIIRFSEHSKSNWTAHSIDDRLCMALIVDQMILKIAECARNEKIVNHSL